MNRKQRRAAERSRTTTSAREPMPITRLKPSASRTVLGFACMAQLDAEPEPLGFDLEAEAEDLP